MPNRERRLVGREVRAEGEEPTISGDAAVFFDESDPEGTQYRLWDNAVERIATGAFERAIQEDDVRGLFNHDPSRVLGRTTSGTMRLSESEAGLHYVIDPPDTQEGRDVVSLIRRGDVSGSSFGFEVLSEQWEKEEQEGQTLHVRTIQDVRLYDVGPVTFPAYESTSSDVRSSDGYLKFVGKMGQRKHFDMKVRARMARLNLDIAKGKS